MEIVSFIKANGMKPIVLTNAYALTPEILRELKRAGLPVLPFTSTATRTARIGTARRKAT